MPGSYRIEVDNLGKSSWEDVMQSFEDASVYQSWSWGRVRWGENSLSHMVLKKDGNMVAAAQAWIMRLPLLEKGIAYVKWGPMWQTKTGERRVEHYRKMLGALRDEYCSNRGLMLRIMPNLTGLWDESAYASLAEEGFVHSRNGSPYRTLLMDLSHPAGELRNGTKRQWRQCLNKAEKEGLSVRCGSNDEMFDVFVPIYREMHRRKGFAEFLDVEQMRDVHRSLPESLKMKVFICEAGGSPLSACIVSSIGDMAIGLLAATRQEGLTVHSSHLLQWKVIESLKSTGCRWYDLGGIDPENYAGTYMFKSGLSGKLGIDTLFRDFECSGGISSDIAVRTADRFRLAHRRLKEWSAKLLHTSRALHTQRGDG